MKRYVSVLNREVHGILLLDKPSGFSSNFLLNKVKNFFCVKKAGYAGTLDPLATGMLPICLGKATKLAKYLLNSDKKYKVSMKLGISTDTFDSNGVIIRRSMIQYNDKKLDDCLKFFKGKSYQVPPMFSSLKYNGLPLYKYARQGINIPRKPRIIYIYHISCINRVGDVIELDIHCSKGTYIRSIINDIGEYLGCGAHVIKLRRVMVGKYNVSSTIGIDILESIFYDYSFSDMEVLSKLDSLLISIENVIH